MRSVAQAISRKDSSRSNSPSGNPSSRSRCRCRRSRKMRPSPSPFYQTVTKQNYQFQSLTTGSNEDDIYQNRQEVKKFVGIDTIETDSYVPDSHRSSASP